VFVAARSVCCAVPWFHVRVLVQVLVHNGKMYLHTLLYCTFKMMLIFAAPWCFVLCRAALPASAAAAQGHRAPQALSVTGSPGRHTSCFLPLARGGCTNSSCMCRQLPLQCEILMAFWLVWAFVFSCCPVLQSQLVQEPPKAPGPPRLSRSQAAREGTLAVSPSCLRWLHKQQLHLLPVATAV
jgi:hypothetical protein